MTSTSNIESQARQNTGTVSALERGIAVLQCFNEDVHVLSNAELAHLTGIPKPTVTRLATTLVSLGLLKQQADTERFSLAAGVVSLARAFLSGVDIRALAQPRMKELADRLGGSVYLAVRNSLDMVLIEICRPRSAILRSRHEVGTRIPLGTSALGRACLARLAATDVDQYQELLKRLQVASATDWPRVLQGLERAHNDYGQFGYCMSLGEWAPEVHSIAVPFALENGGQMALNFGGPAFMFTESRLRDDVAAELLDVVHAIGLEAGTASPLHRGVEAI